MARRKDLEAFARQHGLPIVSIADLIAYRRRCVAVRRESEARLPTRHGVFTACVYTAVDGPHEHLAMVMGKVDGAEDVLVRIPTVVTTDLHLRLNGPRYVTLPNIMKAKKKPMEIVKPSDLGVDVRPRIKTLKVSPPPERGAGVKV